MDVQACLVELGSMAYGTSDLVFRWAKPPDIDPDVELSQYTLKGIVATERIVPSFRDPDESISREDGCISVLIGHFFRCLHLDCLFQTAAAAGILYASDIHSMYFDGEWLVRRGLGGYQY